MLRSSLGYLADQVAGRLRKARRAGRTITVWIRFPGLRSVTLAVAISATRPLTEIAVDLAHLAIADHPGEREITLVAVSVSNLVSEPALQLELPLGLDDQRYRPGTPPGAAHSALDHSLDEVRERFGRQRRGGPRRRGNASRRLQGAG